MKTISKLFFSLTTLFVMASVISAFLGTPLLATAVGMAIAGVGIDYAMIKSGMTTGTLSFVQIFDTSAIAFHGQEATDFARDVILDKAYPRVKLNQIHAVRENIVADEQIAYYGVLGMVGRTHNTANCAPTASTQTIPGRAKTWSPKEVSDRFVECWVNFVNNLNVYGLKKGVDIGHIEDLDAINYLKDQAAIGAEMADLRFAWFGDTAAATIANGGVFKNGTDITYFNLIDGLWKQLIAIVTTDPNRLTAIAKNAGSSYAAQTFTGTDTTNQVATGIFQNLVNNSDERLEGTDGGMILATRSLCKQYKAERLLFPNILTAYNRVESGFTTLEIDGVPIIQISEWDRTIRAYQDDGTKWNKPHRAVYVTKDNIPVGFDTATTANKWKLWYENKDNSVYLDMFWKMDAKVILDYMVQVAL